MLLLRLNNHVQPVFLLLSPSLPRNLFIFHNNRKWYHMKFESQAVGTTIQKLRNEKGLSQEVLSGLADIGRSHLAMIETGKKCANLETLWKIAHALEMKPSELIQQIEQTIQTSHHH